MRSFLCSIVFVSLVFGYEYKKLSKFNTPIVKKDKKECRIICDRISSKAATAKKAIEFYKNSKLYKFKKK